MCVCKKCGDVKGMIIITNSKHKYVSEIAKDQSSILIECKCI